MEVYENIGIYLYLNIYHIQVFACVFLSLILYHTYVTCFEKKHVAAQSANDEGWC